MAFLAIPVTAARAETDNPLPNKHTARYVIFDNMTRKQSVMSALLRTLEEAGFVSRRWAVIDSVH